jgi:hypothetical protein
LHGNLDNDNLLKVRATYGAESKTWHRTKSLSWRTDRSGRVTVRARAFSTAGAMALGSRMRVLDRPRGFAHHKPSPVTFTRTIASSTANRWLEWSGRGDGEQDTLDGFPLGDEARMHPRHFGGPNTSLFARAPPRPRSSLARSPSVLVGAAHHRARAWPTRKRLHWGRSGHHRPAPCDIH